MFAQIALPDRRMLQGMTHLEPIHNVTQLYVLLTSEW
jgi:hypothetical protein